MDVDALLLSRMQFAFTLPYYFPAFTIGLSAFIATLLGMWQRTGEDYYHERKRDRSD